MHKRARGSAEFLSADEVGDEIDRAKALVSARVALSNQSQIADEIGIGQHTMSKWLNGKNRLKSENRRRVLDWYQRARPTSTPTSDAIVEPELPAIAQARHTISLLREAVIAQERIIVALEADNAATSDRFAEHATQPDAAPIAPAPRGRRRSAGR